MKILIEKHSPGKKNFNLMSFSRCILMVKFFGNRSSVQSVLYLEADTTTSSVADWQAGAGCLSVSANINIPRSPLNLSHSIDIWFVFQ